MSAEAVETPTLYTVAEAAKVLGKGPRWLADRIRAGEIEHTRIGRSPRMTPEQLRKVVDAATCAPTATPRSAPARNAWGRKPPRRTA